MYTFNNPKYGRLRVIQWEFKPWFIAEDVAKILEFEKPEEAINIYVQPKDGRVVPQGKIKYTSKTKDIVWKNNIVINKRGVYALIKNSQYPKARGFRLWLMFDVNPCLYIKISQDAERKTRGIRK